MNKKILGLALTSVFAVTALASCNKDDGKIHIKFWYSFGKSAEAPLLEQIKKFETVYPEYKVDVGAKGGYDNLKKAVTLSIPSGKYPDVTLGYPDHLAEYISAEIVEPLDPFMNSEDPEIGIGEGAHNAKDDFLANYMTENRQFDEAGTTYALPFNKSTELMYYNKTVFDHFNVKVPTTWAEFESTGKELQQKVLAVKGTKVTTEDGKVLDFSALDNKKKKIRAYTYDSTSNAFITLVRSFGGTYTEVDPATGKGYIAFDKGESNVKTKEAMEMLNRMKKDESFATPALWQEKYASNLFVKLQTFLTIGSSAGAKHNLPEGGKFEVGVAPIPYNDKVEGAGKSVIQQGTNLIMLKHTNEEVREGAWKLIRFLTAYQDEETGYDPNVEFAMGASYLPVRTSGLNTKVYQDFLSGKTAVLPEAKIKSQSANVAFNAYGDDWTKFTDPAFVGSSKVREKAGIIIPAFAVSDSKEASIDKALNDCYDALPKYIRK